MVATLSDTVIVSTVELVKSRPTPSIVIGPTQWNFWSLVDLFICRCKEGQIKMIVLWGAYSGTARG